MKRIALTLLAAALLVPGTALAKGPTAATLEGPGIGAVTFSGYVEQGGTLGDLTRDSGFFPAMFGASPNVMLAKRPKGDLGPRYTITYTVPGGGSAEQVVQDVYPYAPAGAVTYLAPGSDMFGIKANGGWYQGGEALKATLVEAGLPATARAATADPTSFPTVPVTVLGFGLLLVAGTAVLLRRRTRPATA
ncbi:MAG TPA: hypothetical protein VH968_13800 [Gaiellaceae bacterium]|jgi:hypothetical protein